MADHPHKTRIWFDTEFIDDGRTIELLSIGLVREDGHYMLLENSECDRSKASGWVRENVFPHLGTGEAMTRQEIADAIRGFAGPRPEFWANYASYDWVALCQLYGPMIDRPTGWPAFVLDVQQEAVWLGRPELPRPPDDEHHALADARWCKRAWEALYHVG